MATTDAADAETLLVHPEHTLPDSFARQPWFRRRLLALGAVTSAVALGTLLVVGAVRQLQPNEQDQFYPPGLEKIGPIDSVVELTSSQQYSDMLDLVNKERQKHGLSDLCYNEKLNAAARDHSRDMASHKKMSHTGSDGSQPHERVTKAGYEWRRVAENVARGQTSVADVMKSWMNSPGHRANILTNGISHFGFGVKDLYWTQVFGSPFGDEACSLEGGGEDGHGGRCRDVVPKGQTEWHDSDGKGYHCNWYAQGDHCKKHGHGYKNFGFTANTACCVCGGGGKGDEDAGKAGCMDKSPSGVSEWYASAGKKYHCDWFGERQSRCTNYGNRFRNHGMTANEACCACGGGSNFASMCQNCDEPHSVAPASGQAGKCCYQDCNTHNDCRQPGLFCCPHHKLCMDRTTYSTAGPNCNACSR